MELSQLAFQARNRTPWQVFDLTLLMVKQHFFSLIKIVLSFYLPILILLCLFIPFEYVYWILWWLKPLIERPLLDYLAKASFSQKTTTWQCLQSIKKLRLMSIIRMLTWCRLSPNRAYLAPLEQLEQLSGAKRNARGNLLLGRCNHKQTFWMMFCLHAEMVFTFLIALIVYNFLPTGIEIDEQLNFVEFVNLATIEIIYSICYFCALVLVMPYFVTGSFLMYLNSRIKLEGWDIELAFKRISRASVFVLIGCLFLSPVSVPTVQAEEKIAIKEDVVLPLTERSKKTKQEILDLYKENQWIKKETTWQPKPEKESSSLDLSWLKNLAHFGTVIGYIAWFVVIGLLIWLGVFIINKTGKFNFSPPPEPVKKKTELPVFFDELPSDIIPSDLLMSAKTANSNKNFRLALMCILRFSFYLAEKNSCVEIHKSMSEMECQRALTSVLPQTLHSLYQDLFRLWIQQAWAHVDADQTDITELIIQFENLASQGAEK